MVLILANIEVMGEVMVSAEIYKVLMCKTCNFFIIIPNVVDVALSVKTWGM